MASAQFKHPFLLRRWTDNVNDSRVVFLLRQTFEHHVITFRLVILDKIELPSMGLHHEWVRCLTDFALKSAPKVSCEVRLLLGLPPNLKPGAEALKVN